MIVKGYMVDLDIEKQENLGKELLYAVYPNGTVIRCLRKYSHHFFRKNEKWEVVNQLPTDAIFIGNYPVLH